MSRRRQGGSGAKRGRSGTDDLTTRLARLEWLVRFKGRNAAEDDEDTYVPPPPGTTLDLDTLNARTVNASLIVNAAALAVSGAASAASLSTGSISTGPIVAGALDVTDIVADEITAWEPINAKGAGGGFYAHSRDGDGHFYALYNDDGTGVIVWGSEAGNVAGLKLHVNGNSRGWLEMPGVTGGGYRARHAVDEHFGFGLAYLSSNLYHNGAWGNDNGAAGAAIARVGTSPISPYPGFFDVYVRDGTDAGGIGTQVLHADRTGLGVMMTHAGSSYALDVNGSGHASSWPTSSDQRLKKNIQLIPDQAVDKLLQIRPAIFKWDQEAIAAAGRGPYELGWQIGFIAQDVAAHFPQLTTMWKGTDGVNYYAVDYGRMTAVLVKAVQELNARLAALEG